MVRSPYYSNGKVIPSVTTILGRFKESGALMWWSWDTAYKPLCEAVALLESMNGKVVGGVVRTKIAAFLKTNPIEVGNYRSQSTKAATAGTIAHTLVEVKINAQKEIPIPSAKRVMSDYSCERDIASKAVNSYKAFLQWQDKTKFKLVETEIKLVSDVHGFGGTIDCIGTIESLDLTPHDQTRTKKKVRSKKIKHSRQLCIFDWKTSKGLYTDYIIQLAAYEILWEENNPDKPLTGGAHLVRFDKETADFSYYQFSDLSNEKKQFLAFRECYARDKEIAKRAN